MYITISDGAGGIIECGRDFYHDFTRAEKRGDIQRFMTRYRLLPFIDPIQGGTCASDDPAEYGAVKSVLETCSLLVEAARRAEKGKEPPEIPGFKDFGDGAACIEVDLSGCTWYRLFLYHAVTFHEKIWGDTAGAIIIDRLIPRDGTFKHRLPAGDDRVTDAFSHFKDPAQAIAQERADLLNGSYLGCCPLNPKPGLPEPIRAQALFWDRSTLFVKARGEAPAETLYSMANALLLMHTSAVTGTVEFPGGYAITAPTGLHALWLDYALTVTRKPITVCAECGKPIVEDKPPRGHARRYCGKTCKNRWQRRKNAER